MTEPRRWRDDPRSSEELRKLLEGARPRALGGAERSRVGARVARTAALPVTAAAWLTAKSAAAIGIAAGVATAGAAAVVEYRSSHVGVAPPHPAMAPIQRKSSRSGTLPGRVPAPAAAEVPPEPPGPVETAEAPASGTPKAVATAGAAPGLAEESQLLERARTLLDTAPERSLALLRDHARRFPSGLLSAERRMIEVEALDRLGRRSEALLAAERMLREHPDGLYAERLRRLTARLKGE